jgi:glycosyltransferase involved in cell wall biosynthesis
VTPSYNQANFLEQSMRSVLTQDYPNLEYLVVDGGSTDGSPQIIKKFENQLAWWVSEKDQGQADAVNKGFAHAQGKYCGWLNSDDVYLAGALQQAVDLLEAHPKVGFVFGDVKSIDENNNVTNIMRYAHWQLEDLMRFNIIGQPGVFFRRDLFDKVGGLDLNYHFLLDHQLWLRFAVEAGMLYSEKIWAAARFHSAAKNVANTAMFGVEAIQLAEWMSRSAQFHDAFERNKSRVWAGAYRMKARYLLDGGQTKESIRAYCQGFKFHPQTVIPETHRFIYAFLSLLGFASLKKIFLRIRFFIKRPDRQRD